MDTRAAAETFMECLKQYERSGEIGSLLDCFASDAELHALTQKREHHGREGTRRFWEEYLRPFHEIESVFTHVATGGPLANCEWTARGRLNCGESIEYQGVTLLEFGGDGKIHRFRTYYDSAAFVPAATGA